MKGDCRYGRDWIQSRNITHSNGLDLVAHVIILRELDEEDCAALN